MNDLTENEKRDYQLFFVEGGDPGFSPERNKAVIEDTIKKYERMIKQRRAVYRDQVAERTDAVLTYLRSMKSGTPIEKYFGRRNLAHLRGQKIVQKVIKENNRMKVVLEEIV